MIINTAKTFIKKLLGTFETVKEFKNQPSYVFFSTRKKKYL